MTGTVSPPKAPAPLPSGSRLPDIPGPLETLRIAWRRLRRMATALQLLFALAAASVVATVIPQEPVTAQSVEQWRSGVTGPGAGVARVLDELGLFDVFGSWWFAALTVGLVVSLTGCLLPRWRAFVRVARRPPAAGRNLERLSASTVLSCPLEPEQALRAAERVLGRRRFRRRRVGSQVAAERGHWREGGSLVFHTAFYLLLLGAVIGKVFGFAGSISLAEGGAFADTRIAYDAAQPGREFDLGDHRGFVARLDDFDVSYFPDFTPRDFRSTVTISEDGQRVRTADIRVNHPLRYRGMTLYQIGFGMAPHVVVRAGDQVLLDERVLLAPGGGSNLWAGTAKVKVRDPDSQIALDLALATDARLGDDGQPVLGPDPRPRNPVLVSSLYFGDLGLERPVPAADFDRGDGPVETAMLRPGKTAKLAQGSLTVEFRDLGYWSGLQVTHAPGRSILLAGAALLLVGLIPSLYSYRRRIWVEATPDGAGSRVTVAGVALQRKATFTDEFDAVVSALRDAVGSRPPPRPEAGSQPYSQPEPAPSPERSP